MMPPYLKYVTISYLRNTLTIIKKSEFVYLYSYETISKKRAMCIKNFWKVIFKKLNGRTGVEQGYEERGLLCFSVIFFPLSYYFFS